MNDWSPQQDNALIEASRFLKDPDRRIFRLYGYAGTGKTTLAKHLASDFSGKMVFCAPTGKAAHVLAQKGCPNPMTVHSAIYNPVEKSRRRLRDLLRQLKELGTQNSAERIQIQNDIHEEEANLQRPFFALNFEGPASEADLLIVDEASMVDEYMARDLLSFGCKVLALGDPGQLPPVNGSPGFMNEEGDITLTEIHRQAKDDPILRLATMARKGIEIPAGKYGESEAVRAKDLDQYRLRELAMDGDQVLVGLNKTRYNTNKRIRSFYGRESRYPVIGDKLVCLRNNKDLGLLNGQIWTAASNASHQGSYLDLEVAGQSMSGAEIQLQLEIHRAPFLGEEIEPWRKKQAEEFDFGNALTVHKSQGSQWDEVCLVDEWFGRDRRRWLYTGITRAAKKLTILQR